MTTHSQKKFDHADLIEFRNRFQLPLSDDQATSLAFYKPAADSPEMLYLHAQRHWPPTPALPRQPPARP